VRAAGQGVWKAAGAQRPLRSGRRRRSCAQHVSSRPCLQRRAFRRYIFNVPPPVAGDGFQGERLEMSGREMSCPPAAGAGPAGAAAELLRVAENRTDMVVTPRPAMRAPVPAAPPPAAMVAASVLGQLASLLEQRNLPSAVHRAQGCKASLHLSA
jgi:hypothetical protein